MDRISPLICLAAALVGVVAGCKRDPAPTSSRGAPSASATPAFAERVKALRAAENRRDVAAIVEGDLGHPAAEVRRAAARALARVGSDEARGGLLRLLSDEDPEVTAFAAYGLGWTCREHEEEHVKALAARSVTVASAQPSAAIARALGKCGTSEAEGVLAAWLRGPREQAAAAALGLGDVAARRKLQEETLVALTQVAPGENGLGEALYPFARADAAAGSVATRVREVAAERLAHDTPARLFAIRALGRTDGEAAPELRRVLTGSFRDAERAEAARALGRLGDAGQAVLAEALPSLLPPRTEVALASLVSDGFGPLMTLLESLRPPPPRPARDTLNELARFPLPDPEKTPASIVRRVAKLRCAAARLLTTLPDDPLLLGCDPRPQSVERDLARLAVLGRKPIEGAKRSAELRSLLTSGEARVRTEAFELLAAHREVQEAPKLLLAGLKHAHPGTVAAVAQALAQRSDLVEPGGALEAGLLEALGRAWGPDDVETVSALLDAAGAARMAAARRYIEPHCKSFSPTLRAHAQGALSLLGDQKARCLSAPPLAEPAPEATQPVERAKVVLDTDAGELTLDLDPAWAPVAVARLLDLAAAGFYDDMAIHRVVPGFVVQFGDRAGDGTGGSGKGSLRCETSPVTFGKHAIGVALAGRDTGSSQFFVTLSPTPHLDGEYAWLGTASGDWAAVAEGDRIVKARVVR